MSVRASLYVVLIVLVVTLAAGCAAGSEADYRANIGKTAFNATNGVELGRIEGVARVNDAWVYKVNREGRIFNSPVDNVTVKDTPSTLARTTTPAPGAQIDPGVQATAQEFGGRLGQYGGQVAALTMNADTMTARWSSAKCDSFGPEVIDLLLSVNRTIKESPTITGERTCGGDKRTFSIPGSRLQQYRTGTISDTEILRDASK